jgi:pimeloyl-ACP methyl ester carboxylesterase
VAGALSATGAVAAPATGAPLAFAPCRTAPGFSCTKVAVPLDRSGGVPGTVSLTVGVQQKTRDPVRGAALLLAGGPGQAALPVASQNAGTLSPALDGYRLITFDQRGTGLSGAVNCPALQRVAQAALTVPTPAAVQGCGAQLGPARGLYSTAATVEDIEAVRRALGVPKLALVAISYGTYVAERYARAYPQNVDRMVLDSVVPQEGPDPFLKSTFARIPEALALLCAKNACSLFLRDPLAALGDVAAALRRSPITGIVGGLGGQMRRVSLPNEEALVSVLVSASQSPLLFSRIPSALSSAIRGDPSTLLRLSDLIQNGGGQVPPGMFSAGLNAAALCSDASMPWGGPDAPLAGRADAVARGVAALPASLLAPFGPAAAAGNGLLQMCLNWPLTPVASPPSPGPLPDVPTLFLAGERDLSTPVADATAEASRSPHGTVVVVPGMGHSILSTPPRCVLGALTKLFGGQPVGQPCTSSAPPFSTAPPDPDSLADVSAPKPLPGHAGRLLSAALGAITDAVWVTQVVGLTRLDYGGLRGGRFQLRATSSGGLRLTFRRYTYVPGAHVSGHLNLDGSLNLRPGRLRVSGIASGFLAIRANGTVRGRLGGKRVHLSLSVV